MSKAIMPKRPAFTDLLKEWNCLTAVRNTSAPEKIITSKGENDISRGYDFTPNTVCIKVSYYVV